MTANSKLMKESRIILYE